ncbi:MAG: dehydrogenase [Elusimicrobia bacterium RIFOXYA2_FULL_40_6]|nr:MAG: dehydrogenase [Elusimicrobia bacterium RIFOXYA2_FULL_40_6]
MRKLRAGIIGVGFIGQAHVEALRRLGNVEIVAVSEANKELAQQKAQQFGIPKAYENYQDLINDKDVDVVHNCTPNNVHYKINVEIINAGKHIISEKPLAIKSEESKALVELAEKKNVVNAVCFNYRFYPLNQHSHFEIKNNALGKINIVLGQYLQDWLFFDTDYNWRLEPAISGPSRAIADIGSHWCDLIQFLTGKEILSVCADLQTVHAQRKKPKKAVETFANKELKPEDYESVNINTEDYGSVLVRMEDNVKGVFTVSQVSAGRKNHIYYQIDGNKKSVSWNHEDCDKLWIGHRETANELLIRDASLLNKDAKRFAHYPGGHPEGYPDCIKNLFNEVYQFILTGKDPKKDEKTFPTFKDGHRAVAICEAILESNKAEKWTAVKR